MTENFNMFDKCKTWANIREELDRSSALMVMSGDKDELWVAKEYHNGSKEAAVAGVAAFMFLKANGVGATIEEGVGLYKKAIEAKEKATGETLYSIRKRVGTMEEWIAWSSQCRGVRAKETKRIQTPKWKTPEKYSGLANIFLHVGSTGMDAGGNCDKLALWGIGEFLKGQREGGKQTKAKRR